MLLMFVRLWKVNGRIRPGLTHGRVKISIKSRGALAIDPRPAFMVFEN
jgi:hypothetical protein